MMVGLAEGVSSEVIALPKYTTRQAYAHHQQCVWLLGQVGPLWTQAFWYNNSEVAHRATKLDGKPTVPASIRYAEYCAPKADLSKANQTMNSDLTPSDAPTIINELRAKNPERTHPDRDSATHPALHIWPQKADTGAWWEEEK